MHSTTRITKATRHTTVINMPASSRIRKLTLHVRPPPKNTLHVRPPPRIILHVTRPRKLNLKLNVKPPPPNMSIEEYTRVDAWICEQARIRPGRQGSYNNHEAMGYTLPTPPTTEEEKPTPPNTASSEASLDEGFVVEEQFTPPPTTTVKEEEEEEESISEGESRVRSRTSKMNINAMIDSITRPMVDVNKEAMVGAFWTALSIEAIELEEYDFMVGVLANGKQ